MRLSTENNKQRILVTHPNGNQFVRALIFSLEKRGLLERFYTLFNINAKSNLLNFIPSSLRSEFLRRSFPVPGTKITTSRYGIIEIIRALLKRLGIYKKDYALLEYLNRNFDDSIANKLPPLVKKREISAVYAFEDVALKTFKKAKNIGIKCIYDLPIAYWDYKHGLLREEAIRLPEWAITLGGSIVDSKKKLKQKDEELALADLVVCPSNFVKNSIPEWVPREKIVVSPFGTPSATANLKERKYSSYSKPLKILFTGIMTQRKGLGDLFAAMKLLTDTNVELVILGGLAAPVEFYRSQYPNFRYEPNRPHHEVLELMRNCDVFCLPSIIEGRALVMQEAMSQGLPIIITPNTGGDDLVIEGETGFLVDIRSPKAIAEKILWFHENRDKIPLMGKKAQEMAKRYTWENYATTIINAIQCTS